MLMGSSTGASRAAVGIGLSFILIIVNYDEYGVNTQSVSILPFVY